MRVRCSGDLFSRTLALVRLLPSEPYAFGPPPFSSMNSAPAALTSSLMHGPLKSQGINDFQERELIEIGIAGADLPDAVLAHENCRHFRMAGGLHRSIDRFLV